LQPLQHTSTKVDAKNLDGYAGVYKSSNGAFMVTREGDQLFVQLTGQPKFPLFQESERKFFLKVVDAQIDFEVDAHGRATQLTLHQNGMDQPATRLDDAEAKRIADESAARSEAAATRFKEQKPAPGSEAAVRRAVEELRLGQPDYSLLTFKGVGQGGRDIDKVKFENGLTEFRIAMTPDGKIEGMGFRPL
jgi:hypothetical protein